MSRPVITTYEPGEDVRSATPVGTTFDSFEAASIDVDDEAVAEEGLDERSLVDKFASELLVEQTNTGPTTSNNAAYATANVGGNLRTSGFTVAAGFKGVVVATLAVRSSAAQDAITAGFVAARLQYSVGGTPTAIANTERFIGGAPGTLGGGVSAGGDFMLGTVLPAGTYDWVEVQTYSSDTVSYQLDDGTIFIESYYTG